MNVFAIIEFFMFMDRMVEEYDADESINYTLSAGPIDGRVLMSADPRVMLMGRFAGEMEPCRANQFFLQKSILIGEFRSGWEDECAWAMKQFFDLFPGHHIQHETLRKWVENFKNRKF